MELKEILEKLANGEISSDEAFEQIYSSRRKPRVIRNVRFQKTEEGEEIPEKTHEFPISDRKLNLEIVSDGDCRLHFYEGDKVKIKSAGGFLPSEDKITIMGTADVYLPELEILSISIDKGAIRGEVISDQLNLTIDKGAASLTITCEEANISNFMGAVKISSGPDLKILNLANKLGSIKVFFPEGFKARFNLSHRFGSIKIDPELVEIQSDRDDVPLINITTNLGAVYVSRAASEEPD